MIWQSDRYFSVREQISGQFTQDRINYQLTLFTCVHICGFSYLQQKEMNQNKCSRSLSHQFSGLSCFWEAGGIAVAESFLGGTSLSVVASHVKRLGMSFCGGRFYSTVSPHHLSSRFSSGFAPFFFFFFFLWSCIVSSYVLFLFCLYIEENEKYLSKVASIEAYSSVPDDTVVWLSYPVYLNWAGILTSLAWGRSLLLKLWSFFLPLHAMHRTINFVSSSVKDLILSMHFPFPFLITQSVKGDIRMEIAFRKCCNIYVMYIIWLKILSVCSFCIRKKFPH